MTDLFAQLLEIEAEEREKLHAGHASSRPLSIDYELIGLTGEVEFGSQFNLPVDLKRRASGDGRVDFIIPLRHTVDVKTARKPNNLIEEQGKVTADIYVLASYDDNERRSMLIGWEWGKVLAKAPVRDFGHGIMNHYIPAIRLRQMPELHKRMMRLT